MSAPFTDQKITKVLLLGLDNSGKTSILLSLKEDSNLLSFFSLKPTKGLKIENIEGQEINMSIWDFGGQEQYRDGYLDKFDKYVQGVTKMIFVIDVQDIARYDLALKYLSDIIHILTVIDKKIDFSIFFHKYDPNLKKNDKFKKIDEIMKNKLIDRVKKIIPSSFNYNMFKTSIYTVFDKTLISD